MNGDILTNIHNKLTTFSKGQRRIATYILESYDKAAFLTAGALGKITQVSESTVVRFAAELGYDGYPAHAARAAGNGAQPPDLRAAH